jgi:hypothetical protein
MNPMLATAMLLSAMIGQCPPGRVCPNPAMKVQLSNPAVVAGTLGWHWTAKLDGTTGYVYGHMNTLGQVVPAPAPPHDNFALKIKKEPTPAPTAKPGAENFGINVEDLQHQARGSFESNDVEFLTKMTGEKPRVAEEVEIPRPKPGNPLQLRDFMLFAAIGGAIVGAVLARKVK